jgi:uracil-DNA glycosylase
VTPGHPALPVLSLVQCNAEVGAANFAGDMRLAGARCDECPIGPNDPLHLGRNYRPVESELNGTVTVMGGEAPGETEITENRPFVGPSGMKALAALTMFGVKRSDVSWVNAIACRPPMNELARVDHQVQVENKKREKKNDAEKKRAKAEGRPPVLDAYMPTPAEACRPRYMREMALHDFAITLGGSALKSLLDAQASIMDLRGGPLEGTIEADARLKFWKGPKENVPDLVPKLRHLKLLPTVHPSFVLHSPKWELPFRADIGRAFRFFSGKLGWKAPEKRFTPRPHEVEAWLRTQLDKMVTFDTETYGKSRRQDALEPMIAGCRTIQIGNREIVFVIPFASVHGSGGTGEAINPFYDEGERVEWYRILVWYFTEPRILKAGWNSRYFDRMLIKAIFGVDPTPAIDGIIVNRNFSSEMPHGLGFNGGVYTDVHSWKSEHAATEAKSDEELWSYGAIDVSVAHELIEKQYPLVRKRNQGHLIAFDHRTQDACVGMHELGLRVDHKRRSQWGRQFLKEKEHWRKVCNDVISGEIGDVELIKSPHAYGMDEEDSLVDDAGQETAEGERVGFSPGSYNKLRELMFEKWGLPITHFTDLGEPSTRNEALIALFVNPKLDDRQKLFVRALRRYRRAVKLYGTYIARLDPEHPKTRMGPDGRVHCNYNAHGTTSGRLSSSEPNNQNIPVDLRDIYIPEEGHVFVGADADQLELRMIAAVAKLKAYLEVFEIAEADPHSITALAMFGDRFRKADGFAEGKKPAKATAADRVRDFAKRVCYAGVYKASIETIHRVITSVENKNGDLEYANAKLLETRQAYRSWLAFMPELPKWWEAVLAEFKAQNYLVDPVTARRRDFLDGYQPNEIINYKIQAGGAGLCMAILHDCVERWGFNFAGRHTGVIAQTHDSVTLEVPIGIAEAVKHDLTEMHTRTVSTLPGIVFRGAAKIGENWAAT